MDVRNCKECGAMFNYVSGLPLCPNCMKKMEEKFSEVKAYVYDNPKCGIREVSEANEVPVPIIKKWIRDERLSFSPDSAIGLECESCGKTIYTGRYCDVCKSRMTHRLEGAYQKQEPKKPSKPKGDNQNKMRFLNS